MKLPKAKRNSSGEYTIIHNGVEYRVYKEMGLWSIKGENVDAIAVSFMHAKQKIASVGGNSLLY